MRKIHFSSILFVLFFIYNHCTAQAVLLQARVRDINTHRGISSVNILLKDTKTGTISNSTGLFTLNVNKPLASKVIRFQHVGYDPLEIGCDSLRNLSIVYLQPRIIPLPVLRVETLAEQGNLKEDLPQAVSIIESKDMHKGGFSDTADLLNTDHSVQVDEELSGKKKIVIRGGNPDGVVVLYNNIKLNNLYDNSFDMSLIDLEDVERIEIIKGSHTALYGSGSLSGIINVIPNFQPDYNIRFKQTIGTYNAGNWNLQLHQNLKRLYASYTYKQGTIRRRSIDIFGTEGALNNSGSHHIANVFYDLSKADEPGISNFLNAMFVQSDLKYDNELDSESLKNRSQILSLRFQGDLFWLKDLGLSTSLHRLVETQNFHPFSVVPLRDIESNTIQFNAEKSLYLKRLTFVLAYQLEDARLQFLENQQYPYQIPVLQNIEFSRNHHALVAVAKYHAPSGYRFLSALDFDLSIRHDMVDDGRTDLNEEGEPDVDKENTTLDALNWDETTVRFSTHLNGNRGDFKFDGYMNFGTCIQFPSLFQQVSQPVLNTWVPLTPNLDPERNTSAEVGIELTKHVRDNWLFYGWQVTGNFFKNYYTNKFRSYYIPGIPIAYYDNVKTSHITGLETKSRLYLLKKKITLILGYSRYFLSDKAAFPFKYDEKGTLDLHFNYSGYAFKLHLYSESEQVGWVREYSGGFFEAVLPGYSNMDLHLSKIFEIFRFKLNANASIRNVFDTDILLSGLTFRDRRYYISLGIQY